MKKNLYSSVQHAFLKTTVSSNGEIGFTTKNGRMYSGKNNSSSLKIIKVDHNDRSWLLEKEATKTKGKFIDRLREVSLNARTTSYVFEEKTHTNLVLDHDNKWRPQLDTSGKVWGEKVNKEINLFKEEWERQRYNGHTLEDLKKIAKDKIKDSSVTNKKTQYKFIQNSQTERALNQILKTNKLSPIFKTGNSYKEDQIVSKRSRQIPFEKYLDGKRTHDEYIFAITDKALIDHGLYTPSYDASKSNLEITDPISGDRIDYWGVKTYDKKLFEDLGNMYKDMMNEYYDERLGKLPDGAEHVTAAVWHMDEKTPHLHMMVNNFSINLEKDGQMQIRANDIWKFKEQNEIMYNLKEMTYEKVKEWGFPELDRDKPRAKEKVTTQKEFRDQFKGKNFDPTAEMTLDENFSKEIERQEMAHLKAAKSTRRFAVIIEELQKECSRASIDVSKLDQLKREWLSLGKSQSQFDEFVNTYKDMRDRKRERGRI